MKKYISLLIISLILISCSSSDDNNNLPAINPEFSSSSITLEEGKTTEIQITKGKGPFTVKSSNPNTAEVAINNETIIITAISKGSIIIDVTGSDNGSAKVIVAVSENINKSFMEDPTLRFERAGMSTIKNTDAQYIFYKDKGVLFSSTKNKLGYGQRDGSVYYILEWDGNATVGVKNNPTLRDIIGAKAINKIEVIKAEKGLIWIIYKEKADSPEEKLVQKW